MITKQVEVTRVFEENIYADKTIVVNVGGARSSKSHSITQVMIQKFINEKKKDFLTTRKTNPALKNTAYKTAIKLLKEYKYYNGLVHNKTDQTIYNPKNGNVWLFTSIDNPERIKSTEFNYIHMEEASEFTYDDFMILKLRLSGKHEKDEQNHMYLSLNPNDRHGWIREDLIEKWDIDLIESTYLDAIEFLPAEYVSELKGLKEKDPEYYEVYALGKWAELTGIIWGKPEIKQIFPEVKETIYGMDFGYNHPSVLIEIGIDMDAMALYFRELIYETHLTNSQLIDKMKEVMPVEIRQREIYADSAEPARIEEIYRAGFNIKPADKGKDSVKNGIDMIKRFKRYSLESNTNLNSEFAGYKNKVDKNGKTIDEPVKYEDHSCFIAGTKIITDEGLKSIETLRIGQKVLTRIGFREIINKFSLKNQDVHKYRINNIDIACTKDHKIFTLNNGFKEICSLTLCDMLYIINNKEASKCIKLERMRKLFLKASNIEDIWTLKGEIVEYILDQEGVILNWGMKRCIEKYGKIIMAKSLQAIIYIIKTITHLIINWKILSLRSVMSICQTMLKKIGLIIERRELKLLIKSEIRQLNGIGVKKAGHGIKNMRRRSDFPIIKEKLKHAYNVIKSFLAYPIKSFVPMPVKANLGVLSELTLFQNPASYAEKNLRRINTTKLTHVQDHVQQNIAGEYEGKRTVYNLSIKDQSEYFANGILVKNCDAVRYGGYTHMKELFKDLGPGMVYHKGLEKKERAEVVMEDIELAEKTRQMIAKYGYAALGAFAYSLSMQEGDLRLRLVKLGFREHKPNRFIYGDNFKMPEKPAEKPESKKMREEQEGWVV